MDSMTNSDLMQQSLRILGFAALTLSVRVLTWLSLLGGLGLFGYAVVYPDENRTIAAALYAVLIFIPALWSEKKDKRSQGAQRQPIEERYQEAG
jgi:hypothetical protein